MPLNKSCVVSFDYLIDEIAKQMSTDDIIDTINLLARQKQSKEQKQMTVQDLIEKLKQFPPEQKVCVIKDDEYFHGITVVDNITYLDGKSENVVAIDCTPHYKPKWYYDDDEMDTPF